MPPTVFLACHRPDASGAADRLRAHLAERVAPEPGPTPYGSDPRAHADAAVAAFGVATVVFGLSTSFPLSLVALFALGAADNVSVVVRSTVLQLLTPDSMRGRVSAVNAVFIGTSNEIGELESGVAAHTFGTVAAVAGGGVMTLFTVAAVAVLWPALRALGRLEDLKPERARDGSREG